MDIRLHLEKNLFQIAEGGGHYSTIWGLWVRYLPETIKSFMFVLCLFTFARVWASPSECCRCFERNDHQTKLKFAVSVYFISSFSVSTLPFGGVGHSGFGAYHGKASIETFSHHRSCLLRAQAMEGLNKRWPCVRSRQLKWILQNA